MHESQYWESSLFLTLTYNQENLPDNKELDPEQLRLFHKSVASMLRRKGRSYRYFSSGEYGDKNGRPHYHVIAFGLGLQDLKPYPGRPGRYMIDQWSKGFIDAKPLIYNRARYTAKYLQKQGYIYGKQKILKHISNGNPYPPFLMRAQGLGLRWALDHREELQKGYLVFNGRQRSIPRYYVKKLDLIIPPDITQEMRDKMDIEFEQKKERAKSALYFDDYLNELEWSDDYYRSNLEQRERNIKSRLVLKDLFSLQPPSA